MLETPVPVKRQQLLYYAPKLQDAWEYTKRIMNESQGLTTYMITSWGETRVQVQAEPRDLDMVRRLADELGLTRSRSKGASNENDQEGEEVTEDMGGRVSKRAKAGKRSAQAKDAKRETKAPSTTATAEKPEKAEAASGQLYKSYPQCNACKHWYKNMDGPGGHFDKKPDHRASGFTAPAGVASEQQAASA